MLTIVPSAGLAPAPVALLAVQRYLVLDPPFARAIWISQRDRDSTLLPWKPIL